MRKIIGMSSLRDGVTSTRYTFTLTGGIFRDLEWCGWLLCMVLALSHTHTHKLQSDMYERMRDRERDSNVKHATTLRAVDACSRSEWKKAEELFYEASEALAEIISTQSFHVVFVLDESESMVVLIDFARKSVWERAHAGAWKCDFDSALLDKDVYHIWRDSSDLDYICRLKTGSNSPQPSVAFWK